jgi:MOSC domain-containing protein YiiM
MTGKLIGIAKVAELRSPPVEMPSAHVTIEEGIEGDARGRKRDRQVSVMFRESWDTACAELGVELSWVARRANLLVEGIKPPQSTGGRIAIGDVVLEVMQETDPCRLMERAHKGLKAALAPDWRGGVCCKVIAGGDIGLGDAVSLEK